MGDLISRNALLESMNDRYKAKKDKVPDSLAEGFMQMEKLIKEQPTVESVPVVCGEWINSDGYDEWVCSECGQEENSDDYPTEYGINFCSRCGADMRKKVQG